MVTWSRMGKDGEALLDRWRAAGIELGNHSDKHLDHARTDTKTYLADLERGRAYLAAYLAKKKAKPLRFFRFPFLSEGDTRAKLEAARAYLRDSQLINLPVTIDNQDWSVEAPFVKRVAGTTERYHESMHAAVRHFERVSDQLFERRDVPQILLLHANAVGASEWDALFTWLKSSGHEFVTIDQALADPAFQMAQAYVGDNGSSLWLRIMAQRRTERAFGEVKALLETAGGGVEQGRSARVLRGLRRGRFLRLAERSDLGARGGAGALPEEVSRQEGDGHAVARGAGDARGQGHRDHLLRGRDPQPRSRGVGGGALGARVPRQARGRGAHPAGVPPARRGLDDRAGRVDVRMLA